MNKNLFFVVVVAFVTVLSCKKESAVSKIDPNSSDMPRHTSVDQPVDRVAEDQPSTGDALANQKFPVMTFAKKEHHFGDITEGDKPETTFTFTNTGATDLIISSASGSCGCTVPDYPKQPIKPGKSAKLKVSFDSTGKPGMQQKTVTISSNTQQGTEVLTIKANVVPKTNVSTLENQ